MPVTASGMLSLPVANLRTLLSTVTSFQTWVGAVDAAEALLRIHEIEVAQDSLTRPFAVVDDGEEWTSARLDGGGAFRTEGALVLLLEEDVAVANQASERDAQYAFTNAGGAILEELWSLSGAGGTLHVTGIEKIHGPARSEQNERETDDYMQMILMVRWG